MSFLPYAYRTSAIYLRYNLIGKWQGTDYISSLGDADVLVEFYEDGRVIFLLVPKERRHIYIDPNFDITWEIDEHNQVCFDYRVGRGSECTSVEFDDLGGTITLFAQSDRQLPLELHRVRDSSGLLATVAGRFETMVDWLEDEGKRFR